MKKLFTGMLVALVALTGCDFLADAGSYSDQTMEYDTVAVEAFDEFDDDYFNAYTVEEYQALEEKRQETIAIIEEQRDLTLAMEPFKGETDLRDKFAWGQDEMIKVLENQYKELIELEIDYNENGTDNLDRVIELSDEIYDRIEEIYAEVIVVQEKFGDENNIEYY